MFPLQTRLEHGLTGIDEVLIASPEARFGRLKESGLGKECSWQSINDTMPTGYTRIVGP